VLEQAVLAKGERTALALTELAAAFPGVSTRGRGLVHGLVFDEVSRAGKVCQLAFEHGLLVETSGSADEVVKLLPPLTITDDELDHGLALLAGAVEVICG
jgi:diaminobutyrate-2-oxoglutarate transaminase